MGGQEKEEEGEQGSQCRKTACAYRKDCTPLQAIPNVPSPSCQSLSRNLFQEPLAKKPVFLSSLDYKFLESVHVGGY